MAPPLTFAYYCSGHGYGHATRVSAFATHLLELESPPTVHIISSAPKHVFATALKAGAHYRYAEIDPVIVQPLAYHVDRRKSVDVLKNFLADSDRKIKEEIRWLQENHVDCVLSDAAFLACKAANSANIPSVLITNFSFDSVYSYLSVKLNTDATSPLPPSLLSPITNDVVKHTHSLNDNPIDPDELQPLVDTLQSGYRCADLLLLLPGNIPMPSFGVEPSLPSYLWTNPDTNTFYDHVMDALDEKPESVTLHPSIPFDCPINLRKRTRLIKQAPLVVRHPSPDVYTADGRKRVLDYIGVPQHLQSNPELKILIVSFGGQFFRKPTSRNTSRNSSGRATPSALYAGLVQRTFSTDSTASSSSAASTYSASSRTSTTSSQFWPNCGTSRQGPVDSSRNNSDFFIPVTEAVATPSHLWIPGAPPANKDFKESSFLFADDQLTHSPISLTSNPPSPAPRIELSGQEFDFHACTSSSEPNRESDSEEEIEAPLLPDKSWIAIVCGASPAKADDEVMPENFFVAPKDIYMPDLTAVSDVLLGKLGYGTVSECVDACTPFVYVPRPLFVEEHGLRRLLQKQGVGVELSREQYEAGDWAEAVHAAWLAGKAAKAEKRKWGDDGSLKAAAHDMALNLTTWVDEWREQH